MCGFNDCIPVKYVAKACNYVTSLYTLQKKIVKIYGALSVSKLPVNSLAVLLIS